MLLLRFRLLLEKLRCCLHFDCLEAFIEANLLFVSGELRILIGHPDLAALVQALVVVLFACVELLDPVLVLDGLQGLCKEVFTAQVNLGDQLGEV